MKFIKIKHIILIILGTLTLFRSLDIGDYCEGMGKGLLWILSLLFFIGYYLILTIINFYNKAKFKEKIDYKLILIFLITISLNYFYLISQKDKDENAKGILIKAYENNSIQRNNLLLFNDYTFKIEENWIENRCYTFGNYKIRNNTIHLLRDDISTKTQNAFTNKYFIKDSLLIPIDNENKIDTLKINFKNVQQFP